MMPFQVTDFPTSCPPIDYMMQDADALAVSAAAAAVSASAASSNKSCSTLSSQPGIVVPDDYVTGKESNEKLPA